MQLYQEAQAIKTFIKLLMLQTIHLEQETYIPPEGYVIQFSPSITSSTEHIQNENASNFTLTQENGHIKILGDSFCFNSCHIYDYLGRKIAVKNETEFNIASENPQVVILQINGDCGQEVHKLMID